MSFRTSLDNVPGFLDGSVTLVGFRKAGLLACRVHPLRVELFECPTHVIAEYDGDGRCPLEFCHGRCCFLGCLLKLCLGVGIPGVAFLFEAKPMAGMYIEIHEAYENWVVELTPVAPPFLPLCCLCAQPCPTEPY